MATNPGQGNTTQGNYVGFPAGGTTTNVYVYTTVAIPIVGTILFWTGNGSITAPIGTYKIAYPDGTKKLATVNGQGVITALTICEFSSTKYADYLYTSTKNNCTAGSCSVSGSTVTLNDGNSANVYVTSGTYTSNISQADADSQAQAIADAAFNAGKQNKVNELGYCTWTYNNGSVAANAYFRPFTRNNCASNCDAGTWTTYSVAKSGYSYTSTDAVAGCQGAVDGANLLAYNAAKAEVDNNGQANANANATCCCWNLEYYCTKANVNDAVACQRRSREVNACSGATRNDTLVANGSCACDQTCGGTYLDYYCAGIGNLDRYRVPRYNCSGNTAGSPELYQSCDSVNCGASSNPSYEYKGYSTCYNCVQANVYQQVNKCAANYTGYYVYSGGYQYVGGQPTASTCNTSSNCVDVGGGYCSGPNYVINRSQNNPCSNDSCPVRVIEYNSQTYGCYNPCDGFRDPNYTSQGYATCISCQNFDVYRDGNSCSYTYQHYFVDNYGWQDLGTSAPGGGCNYTSNCADTGSAYCSGPNWVIDTYQTNGCLSGGCGTRVIEYNSQTHGCYSPPSCTAWRLENYNYYGLTDYIEWTDCNNYLHSQYLSDMSYLDICFKNGTSVTYTYSTPSNNGTC